MLLENVNMNPFICETILSNISLWMLFQYNCHRVWILINDLLDKIFGQFVRIYILYKWLLISRYWPTSKPLVLDSTIKEGYKTNITHKRKRRFFYYLCLIPGLHSKYVFHLNVYSVNFITVIKRRRTSLDH